MNFAVLNFPDPLYLNYVRTLTRLFKGGFPGHLMKRGFIIVDAMVIKVREEGRVRQRGLLIAIGINEEGYREVLGFMVGDSESEESWGEFFSWLKQRGLHGVDLIVSDQHKGLVRAISQYFQGATWQRCQTHFMRNILDKTPKQLQKEIHGKVRAIRKY